VLTENIALEDFGRIAVEFEHADIERENVFRCGISGAGGCVPSDRLHIRRQVLRPRGSIRSRKRNACDCQTGEALQKQITAHDVSPPTSLHLDAQMLRITSRWVIRTALMGNVLADRLTKCIEQGG
jgi:hypothetical protein